ncbi:MAG: MOSC domain-containing protein [Oscillospiraceae bacterium]|jgi:MOSC domain-containing protein YiiM|nr:MOSC domain-containing protein [Oscillospiraceae bacterium]
MERETIQTTKQIHPKVLAVCISESKGMVKTPVPEIRLKTGYGIIGDAHAGIGQKQVSLLANESVQELRNDIPSIKVGDFAENILTEGIILYQLPIGTKLRIGEALLEVRQVGKECHNGACAIKQQVGDCCMPREGIFTTVLKNGVIKAGDDIEVDLCGMELDTEVAW